MYDKGLSVDLSNFEVYGILDIELTTFSQNLLFQKNVYKSLNFFGKNPKKSLNFVLMDIRVHQKIS